MRVLAGVTRHCPNTCATTTSRSFATEMADHPTPADAFLTGKAVRSEIKLKDLAPGDRVKFDEAMAKEWSSWQKFGAVEKLSLEQVRELPQGTKIIGTRWAHTDKNQKPRLLVGHIAQKSGKSKQQIEKAFAPKSRLIVQGCQEENTEGIRSDSPTASLLAFNLLCAVAVTQKWIIAASDPKKLFRALRANHWLMSRIEAALFFLFHGGSLVGILLSHVDDLFSAGEGKLYEESLSKLEVELHLKVNARRVSVLWQKRQAEGLGHRGGPV